jgi:hypothetical protein
MNVHPPERVERRGGHGRAAGPARCGAGRDPAEHRARGLRRGRGPAPADAAGLRRDDLHRLVDRAGDAEPVHRRRDRGRGAHGLPALVRLDGHRRDRDPGVGDRHLPRAAGRWGARSMSSRSRGSRSRSAWSSTTRSWCSRTSTGGSRGDRPRDAAYRGGKEVWGAILASTLTTAAVFIPVLTIQEEAGQLFRDIALAIVASVVLSLVVSITVIPAAGSRWLRSQARAAWAPRCGALVGRICSGSTGSAGPTSAGSRVSADCSAGLMTRRGCGWTLRPLVIVLMTGAEHHGRRRAPWRRRSTTCRRATSNLVFGGILIPPGHERGRTDDRVWPSGSRIRSLKPYLEHVGRD